MAGSSSVTTRTGLEGSLTVEKRLNVGGVYILAWIVATYLGIFGFRIGMALHLALPLLALAAALAFPQDFTVLKNFSVLPYGLAGMWLIAGTLLFGSPYFVSFLDPQDQFKRPEYLIGGILAGVAVVTEIYLAAVAKYNEQARRTGDLKSEASREATKELREDCQRALADLKSYKQEHGC
jgi:hypothetical protein